MEENYQSFIYFFVFIYGILIGSFINVCIYRLPYERSIVFPGSSCPHCGTPIKWWQNVPLISYIVLMGKCFYCHRVIPARYFFVELLSGTLCAVLYYYFGGLNFSFIFYYIFACLLIIVFFIDMDCWIIPDIITLPGAILGLLGSFFLPLEYLEAVSPSFFFPGIKSAIMLKFSYSITGGIMGFCIFYIIRYIGSRLARQEAMGWGDIKLAVMIGAFLGWQKALVAIFLSFFLGVFFAVPLIFLRRKKGKDFLPFGTFMAMASVISLFGGKEIINFYLNWPNIIFKFFNH